MAESSYPDPQPYQQLLGLDEREKTQLAVHNLLQNAPSYVNKEELIDFLRPCLPKDIFETPRPSIRTPQSVISRELPTYKNPSSEELIPRPCENSYSLQGLDDLYPTPLDEPSSLWEDVSESSSSASNSLDDIDPASEMQALRARLDILQSRISPSKGHTLLESSQSEGNQYAVQCSNADEFDTSYDIVRDIKPKNVHHDSTAWDVLRSSSSRTFAPARDPFTRSPERSPRLQQKGGPISGPRIDQPNLFSVQSQPIVVETSDFWNVPAVSNLFCSRQPALWYFHRSISGDRSIQVHSYSSSPASSRSSRSLTRLSTDFHPPPQTSLPRGTNPRSRLPSSTSTSQLNVNFGPKRRRVISTLHLPQSNHHPQLRDSHHPPQLRDWNAFVSNAATTENIRDLVGSSSRFRGVSPKTLHQHHTGSAPPPARRQYQHLVLGPALQDYPLSPFTPGLDVIFVTQLFPDTFSSSKRIQLLTTIRAAAPYLPLCVWGLNFPAMRASVGSSNNAAAYKVKQKPMFKHPFGPNGSGWPTNSFFDEKHPRSLPVELFESIGSFLPRDSIQNMRLVNREFESKISCFAFKSVVVPFKPKIYESASASGSETSAKSRGKQKETSPDDDASGMGSQSIKDTYNPKESHVKDGMRVFEQWGPEIKKFALTFEVAEDNLTKLKPKKKFEVQNTFWGSYKWPHSHYSRYEQVAKLEQKADETSAMTAAFSKLTGIRELGLSVLSGLGWLSGRDVSDRAILFRKKPTVFGSQYVEPDQGLRESMETWEAITRLEGSWTARFATVAAGGFFEAAREFFPGNNLPRIGFRDMTSDTSKLFPPIMFDKENLEAKFRPRLVEARDEEVDSVPNVLDNDSLELSKVLAPNALTSEQEDWLMEMEWAQGAFLSSWCIALLDNPTVFHSLRTFNIANLSSKYLVSLGRNDIWRALPSLEDMTVLVSPDWRQVCKDVQGTVSTKSIRPSSARFPFWEFLSALFGCNTSIINLKIGYIGGGEHATGMFARNQNILPAPIDKTSYKFTGSSDTDTLLHFPHVEHLTLTNCWLYPIVLQNFFTNRHAPQLKTLTFDSVSLTAPTTPITATDDDDDGDDNNNSQPAINGDRFLSWLTTNPHPFSWPGLINHLSPGVTIAHARSTHGVQPPLPESPNPPSTQTLLSLTFQSCGYVRLTNMSGFDQSRLCELPLGGFPRCLKKRRAQLQKGMLDGKDDGLLGTVVPCLREEEEGALKGVWGMRMGWGEEEGWEVREDVGFQGGSGRFSGVVGREVRGGK